MKTCAGHIIFVGRLCNLCIVVVQVESPVYSRQVEIPLYFIYIYMLINKNQQTKNNTLNTRRPPWTLTLHIYRRLCDTALAYDSITR